MQDVMITFNCCSCDCSVYLRLGRAGIIGSYPGRNPPVFPGNLCSKGWHLHEFIHSGKQLTGHWYAKKVDAARRAGIRPWSIWQTPCTGRENCSQFEDNTCYNNRGGTQTLQRFSTTKGLNSNS